MLYIKNRSKKYSFKILTALIASLLFNACDVTDRNNHLNFDVYYGSKKLNCEASFTQNGQQWRVTQLQFYVHNIELQNNKGQWHAVSPSIAAKDHQKIALVGGVCGAQQQWQVNLKEMIALSDQQAIRFTLGVPFHLNHKNPLTQPSPLNQPDMFWTWQTGHKFLRLELESDNDSWLFHLGSTGCQSPAPVRPPESACKNPNRSQITLALPPQTSKKADSEASNSVPIKLDLKSLLSELDLTDSTSCQSSPDTKSCPVLLSKLGIEKAANGIDSSRVQTVFTVIQ
ncbi:putative repeat protein (TIGR04052 family) [Pleionea mediterranea]|uniref:Putative repeat protein (TIGR04052 family) n=1 Tax=Pleionea mediterranea TaxID=523701 RepID=A0A316FQS7_9GAMM|nr:putative repeat protein (TIGR04052 family) [Pleionea mediterranea]